MVYKSEASPRRQWWNLGILASVIGEKKISPATEIFTRPAELFPEGYHD
jgi:hypothetical protein